MARYARQIMERKREINRLAAVSRLVPEIVSEILIYVAHDSIGLGREWLKATHICRDWREIALHSPRVWNHLHLTSNVDCSRELIARSKETPLYVSTSTIIPDASLDLVIGQLYRIHTLQLVIVPKATTDIPPHLDAPELRHLELEDRHLPVMQHSPCPFEGLDAPKLEQLCLRFNMFCVPWKSMLFRNSITHLHLKSLLPPNSTLDEFLSGLARMPNLKSVFLSGVLPLPSQDSRQTVHLSHLETFTIQDDCDRCVSLLQHLVFPPTVALRISLSVYGSEKFAQLGRHIAAMFSNPRSSSASIRSLLIRHDKCVIWRKQFRIVDIAPDNPNDIGVVVSLPSTYLPSFSIFRHIVSPLTLSNVHTLYIATGAFGSDCKSLSDSMPNLRELGVSSDHEDDQEILNLLVVRSPQRNYPAPQPLFSHLKILLLSGITWYDDPYDDAPIMIQLLRDMLRSRKLSQRMIEELVVRDAINLHESSLEDVHGVVGKVTWDPKDCRWEGFGEEEDEEDEDEEL